MTILICSRKYSIKMDFVEHLEAIYNKDETGMPLEPHSPKVVAQKGQKFGIRHQAKTAL